MTYENQKKLLVHFEKLARGEGIPENHRDAALVIKTAKENIIETKERIAKYESKNPKLKEEIKEETKPKKVK